VISGSSLADFWSWDAGWAVVNLLVNTGEMRERMKSETRKSTLSLDRSMMSARESSKGAFATFGEDFEDKDMMIVNEWPNRWE